MMSRCSRDLRQDTKLHLDENREEEEKSLGCLRFSTKDSALGGPMARSNTTGKYQISSKQEGKMI